MLRLITAGIELAGYVLIFIALYLIEPKLLLGAGGVALIGIGLALGRARETPE